MSDLQRGLYARVDANLPMPDNTISGVWPVRKPLQVVYNAELLTFYIEFARGQKPTAPNCLHLTI
jgi:hypothetical protein